MNRKTVLTLLSLALFPDLLPAQAPTTRTWTGAGPHPTLYSEAANWNPSTAAPGMNDFVRFDGTGVSALLVFTTTSREMNILNASVQVAVADDWRFIGPGVDVFSSILIGAGGSLSLTPVPVLGIGIPGMACPARLTGETMVLGLNANSGGQFTANAELAAVDLTLHGNLIVGNLSQGLFTLLNGARARVDAAMNIGQFTVGAPRTDTVLLQGAGTTLAVPNGRINLSAFNPAQFTVRDGASASSSDMRIGTGNSGNGTALIFGTNSLLAMPGTLTVADQGIGALTIRQGGRVASGGGIMASGITTAQGTVTAQNAGSRWDVAGGVIIGAVGRGTLNVEDQAIVTMGAGQVAVGPGSRGSVNLGAGTRLEVAGELALGGDFNVAGGTASLLAPSGSTLAAGTLRLWPGSSLGINGGVLNLGRAIGNGAINFAFGTINFTGGDVTLGESGLLPQHGNIVPGLNFTVAQGLIVPAGGNLRVAGGTFTAGRVTTRFGGLFGSTVNFTLSASVDHRGVLEGPSTAGAWLTLAGDVSGAGNCLNNVAFAAGYFPGAFGPARAPLQNARFSASSSLHLNLGGLASTERDSVNAVALTLEGGALDVALINGFTPAVGDEFDLLDFTTLSGRFGALYLPALPGNLYWDTTQLYTTGRISVGIRRELRLSSVSPQPGNSLLVQGSGEPGYNYSLEVSTDLVHWSWRTNVIADAGGLWTFLDSGVLTTAPRRFYRAHGEPSLPSGLVSWYRAELDYRDSFGPNNGTANAASPGFGPGRKGQAFEFNGSSHTLSIGGAAIAPPWTAALWVNRQDSPDASSALLWDRNGAGAGSALKLEQFGVAGRRVGFTRFGVADYAFNYTAPANTWTHLAFVGTASATTLYVNGVARETIAAGIPLPFVQLGGPAGDRLKGLVDELTIFNRALTPTEIQQVRDATSGP